MPSNLGSYTCSTQASASIPATSNPPSPSIGVYNSKEGLLRTASKRTYFLPEKRDPVDLTQWLEQERRQIGDWWFAQEYECEFLDAVDQVFRGEDIEGALDTEVKPLEWFR